MRKTYAGVLSRSTATRSRWRPPQPMQVGGGICSFGSAIFRFRLQLEPFQWEPDCVGACLDGVN
jgi:hypothetical protein